MGVNSDAAFSRGDYMRRLERLEREVEQLRSARRLEHATIGQGGLRVRGEGGITLQDGGGLLVESGGDIEVLDGGQVILRYPTDRGGDVVTILGDIFDVASGEFLGTGLLVQQPNGFDIIQIRTDEDAGSRFFLRSGDNLLVLTTAADGFGLDRPYLEVPMYPNDSSGDTTTSSTSFEPKWTGRFRHTHPAMQVQIKAAVTGSPLPQGEMRLMLNGVQIGNTETVTSNFSDFFDFGSGDHDVAPAGMGHYEFQQINIECRISSGTGTLHTSMYGVTKRGFL